MEQTLLFSTVYLSVAWAAERQAVGYLIAQIGVILPCLYVVSVQMTGSPAMLAGFLVSFEYGGTPVFISVICALLGACASGRVPLTSFRTVFRRVSVWWNKRLSTITAVYRLCGVGVVVTRFRAINLRWMGLVKGFVAARALNHSALITIKPLWLTGYKRLSALPANKFVLFLFREVQTLFTKVMFLGWHSPTIGTGLTASGTTLLRVADRDEWLTALNTGLLNWHNILLKATPANLRRYCLGSTHETDGSQENYKRKSALWVLLPRQAHYSTSFLNLEMSQAFPGISIHRIE